MEQLLPPTWTIGAAISFGGLTFMLALPSVLDGDGAILVLVGHWFAALAGLALMAFGLWTDRAHRRLRAQRGEPDRANEMAVRGAAPNTEFK